MDALRKLFTRKPPAQPAPPPPENVPAPITPFQLPPALPLRLADPSHPARPLILQIAASLDQHVEVELSGERVLTKISAIDVLKPTLELLEQAIAQCPDDLDLLVFKASLYQITLKDSKVSGVLDQVLQRDPTHFDARMWREHGETWGDACRSPTWHETDTRLHPVMAAHLAHDHRAQLVRDGLQKTLAIVTDVQGPPFAPRTQVKIAWYLSETPYGPLVAYYLKLIEAGSEPSTMEAFIPLFEPSLFSPLEGCFLMEQLAFSPYCYVVLVSGQSVSLNRRYIFGPRTTKTIRQIAAFGASTKTYLPKEKFKSAMQWHMNNFDLERVFYE